MIIYDVWNIFLILQLRVIVNASLKIVTSQQTREYIQSALMSILEVAITSSEHPVCLLYVRFVPLLCLAPLLDLMLLPPVVDTAWHASRYRCEYNAEDSSRG